MDEHLNNQKPKKSPGNPHFKKGIKNKYFNKGENSQKTETNMADITQEPDEDIIESGETITTGEGKTVNMNSDKIPEAEIPFAGPRVNKDYASIGGDQTVNGNQTTELGQDAPQTTTQTLGNETATDPNNPAPNDPGAKSEAQIRTEAEQFAALLLKAYEKLHGVGRWYGKVDIDKLTADHMAGKINLNLELPLGKNGSQNVQVGKWFQQYNTSIDESLTVSESFKEEIMPPLTRIAIKRGWGLGDEGTVLMLVAEDAGTKAAILFGLKNAANQILDVCHKLLKAQNAGNKNVPAETGKKQDEAETEENEWKERDATVQDTNFEEVLP